MFGIKNLEKKHQISECLIILLKSNTSKPAKAIADLKWWYIIEWSIFFGKTLSHCLKGIVFCN